MVHRIVKADHVLAEKTVHRVHHTIAYADRRRSADGLTLIKGGVVVVRAACGVDVSAGYGGGEKTVAESGPAEGYGLKKAGVLKAVGWNCILSPSLAFVICRVRL